MTAIGAVEGSIAGVIKGAVASVDWGLAIRLGAFGRIPDGDPLGIAFEPASHRCFSFARFPSSGRACCVSLSFPRNFFRADLSKLNWRPVRRFLDARAERAAGRATAKRPERAGAACLYGVHCRCSCSLIVKEELNIFPSASHPIWRPRKKCGGAEGLEPAMRSPDDLPRQARPLLPGQRRRSPLSEH